MREGEGAIVVVRLYREGRLHSILLLQLLERAFKGKHIRRPPYKPPRLRRSKRAATHIFLRSSKCNVPSPSLSAGRREEEDNKTARCTPHFFPNHTRASPIPEQPRRTVSEQPETGHHDTKEGHRRNDDELCLCPLCLSVSDRTSEAKESARTHA